MIRLGPSRIVCCLGIGGVICILDWLNHSCGSPVRWICNKHERLITGGE